MTAKLPILLAGLLIPFTLGQAAPALNAANALWIYGPMYAMLGWFMLRGERIMSEIRVLSHRIDGLTKAMLVDVLSRENAGSQTRQTAQEMLAKINTREEAQVAQALKWGR